MNNYRILARKARGQLLLPMVKANAYGHDAAWTANILIKNPAARKKLFALGVATFSEALELRKSVPRKITILVFSDCAPFSRDWVRLCCERNFEPVISELRTLLEFQKFAKSQKSSVPFHVEVNTGMNRLGIPVDSLPLLQLQPRSVFTHFAESENPSSTLTKKQVREFKKVIRWKDREFPGTLIHFANSGAIWNSSRYRFFKQMDLVRPGLSLYGIRPFEKAKNDGLRPVMTFQAPVIQKIFLRSGDRVGYGGTFQAKKNAGEWIATLGAGYADGVFRAFSNQDPILGKVSMDLIAVKAATRTKIGDWISLWGNGVDPYAVASRAKTIPYEITTRIGERVKRIYD